MAPCNRRGLNFSQFSPGRRLSNHGALLARSSGYEGVCLSEMTLKAAFSQKSGAGVRRSFILLCVTSSCCVVTLGLVLVSCQTPSACTERRTCPIYCFLLT